MPRRRQNNPVSAGLTDIGCVRKRNEDDFYSNDDDGLYIVADGMGGHLGGHVASHMVTGLLPRFILKHRFFLRRASRPALGRHLGKQITKTSRLIRQKGEREYNLHGMGSTVVTVLIRRPWALIGNMGDSRLYLLRKGRLIQVSEDHSTVNLMVQRGEITREQARVHPARNLITRFAGMDDLGRPDLIALWLLRGDRLLLCSDGLNDMIHDHTIESILNQNRRCDKAVNALVEAARDAGGGDNITAVVVDV